MFWDPERFPIMSYEVWKELGNMSRFLPQSIPWYWKILFRFYMPKSFSKVKDMKKLAKFLQSFDQIHVGIFEYREDALKSMNTTSEFMKVMNLGIRRGWDTFGFNISTQSCRNL
jgi:hypothetical protein